MKLRIPQELLKLIACVSMLIDHVGAVLFPQMLFLRLLGRLAFPIYCFLLVEGMTHTRSPRRYLLRLLAGALLSELPFDWLFHGSLTWTGQSVMVTLLLGGGMLLCVRQAKSPAAKLLLVALFAFVAESAMCDYGAMGILLIAVFALIPQSPSRTLCVLALCLCQDLSYLSKALSYLPQWHLGTAVRHILATQPPVQTFALAALLPIWLYSGKKLTRSRVLQWGFYLFYPLHLAALGVFVNYLL